jgi:integrase
VAQATIPVFIAFCCRSMLLSSYQFVPRFVPHPPQYAYDGQVMPTQTRRIGHLYPSRGAWYGRWRSSTGRNLNRKVGPLRSPAQPKGLTRPQAEKALRRMEEDEERIPRMPRGPEVPTVDDVADSLRKRMRVRGLRKSSLESCESIQRVHITPHLGSHAITAIDTDDVESFADTLLNEGLAPKTVRNILGFLHQVFEHAISRKLIRDNPVRHAEKPGRKQSGPNPNLQFLTVSELEAVIRKIPDKIVIREPKPTRKGRRGPSPPPSPDVLGPVLRVMILAAAVTGLRMSELLGLRWCDVDWKAQRLRVRNTYVRGEHSSDGKSDLSTKRSVPMATLLAGTLDRWSRRTAFSDDLDLVFAHPQTGKPLDRSKVLKRFKAACKAAGAPVIRFHDLRHTFGTRLAAKGVPLRTIQEFMGHADTKTTQIYVHYARSEHEIQLVDDAFAPDESNPTADKEHHQASSSSESVSPAD